MRLKYPNLHLGRSKHRFLMFAIGLLALFAVVSCSPQAKDVAQNPNTSPSASPAQLQTVRIGYQKFNTLNILKARGTLEKSLAPSGISVQWVEFSAGPQLLEALNVGSIDFGHAADTPPIGAQAAGTPLIYVASEPPYPKGLAVLVRQDSPIKTAADLKGKKIAIGKGWNVFNLLVRAIEDKGLKLEDIQPVFVKTAADAVAAFEQGGVDAFGTWDPFYAVSERITGARLLFDGTGLVRNHTFYFASKSFADKHSDTTKTILQELKKIDDWANANPREVAEFLSPQLKIGVADLEKATKRREYGVQAITDKAIAEQQRIADTFFRLKLIPKQIDVRDAVIKTQVT